MPAQVVAAAIPPFGLRPHSGIAATVALRSGSGDGRAGHVNLDPFLHPGPGRLAADPTVSLLSYVIPYFKGLTE